MWLLTTWERMWKTKQSPRMVRSLQYCSENNQMLSYFSSLWVSRNSSWTLYLSNLILSLDTFFGKRFGDSSYSPKYLDSRSTATLQMGNYTLVVKSRAVSKVDKPSTPPLLVGGRGKCEFWVSVPQFLRWVAQLRGGINTWDRVGPKCWPERLESPHWLLSFEAALWFVAAGGKPQSDVHKSLQTIERAVGRRPWSWQRHFLSAEDLDFGASGSRCEVFEVAEPYLV